MVVDLNRLARLKHYKLKEMQIKHIKVVSKQLAGPGFETPHLHKNKKFFEISANALFSFKIKKNMETLSFAFGMLAMIAIILIAIVVIGIVKVFKQDKINVNTNAIMDEINSSLHRRIDNMETRFDRHFDDLYRELESKIEHVDSEMSLRINDTSSYIDSRIDKLQNNIKEKGSKELLKG